jgi:glycosyltransferase involved in cell wall biosynthesis
VTRRPLGVAVLVYNIDATGGMERQALQLATHLAARGAKVVLLSTFFVPGYGHAPPFERPLVERRGRLTLVRVPLFQGWGHERSLRFYEAVAALLLMARAPALDAIYAVQWTAGLHAVRLGRLLGRAVFVKFAGGGVNGDIQSRGRDPRGAEMIAELGRAHRIVCISPEIADEARGAGLAESQLLRVPNGIDLSRFERPTKATLDLPPGTETILFVGALRREKRLPWLLRSFARLATRRPAARLILAGDGPEAPAARRLAAELGLGERVVFLGDRRDVPALLATSRVFVLSSESEGLSNALLEALASGVPIVATDLPSNAAVARPDREALLVPLADEEALASALERVLADPALAARLAAAGRERVRDYSFERVAALHEEAFSRAPRTARSSAALLLRYLREFESPGLLGIAREVVRELAPAAQAKLVVAVKRRLGLEVATS